MALSAYAVKARASLSHSKAPASDPSARLRAGGGRYKGGERFLVCRMSDMNVRPLKRAGLKDQRYIGECGESERASLGDRRG